MTAYTDDPPSAAQLHFSFSYEEVVQMHRLLLMIPKLKMKWVEGSREQEAKAKALDK